MESTPFDANRLKVVSRVVTAVLCAGVAVAAFAYERDRVRWWKDHHPLSAPRRNLARARASYVERQDTALMYALGGAAIVESVRVIRHELGRHPSEGEEGAVTRAGGSGAPPSSAATPGG